MSKKPITEGNPALAFISSVDEEETTVKDSYTKTDRKTPAKANKQAQKKQEKDIKNYRINLALTSSLGEALKEEAWKQHRSVNSLVEEIIQNYLK